MAEPPSLWLLLAANLSTDVSYNPLWQVALGLFSLGLSGLFSAGLMALSKRAQTEPKEALAAEVTSAQLGRTVAAFAFIALLSGPVQTGLARVLSFLPSTGALVWILSLLSLSTLFVLVTLQLAKSVAWAFPETTLKKLQPVLRIWHYLSYPLWRGVSGLMQLVRLPVQKADVSVQLQTLRQHINEEAQAQPDNPEKSLIKNVFDFSEVVADDIMVPRADVMWISTEDAPETVLNELQESSHTRFPICEGTPDEVVGYLHIKDLTFLQTAYLEGRVTLTQLARPLIFVPESAKGISLLERFRLEHTHLAIVVDEFGGMAGIITMEDLLEELVGEIQDEFDLEEAGVSVLASGDFLADGSVRLDDLSEKHGLEFGEVDEDTLGGFVFGRLARQARVGDEVVLDTFKLRVLKANGPRVTRVRIVLPKGEGVELPTKPSVGALLTNSMFMD